MKRPGTPKPAALEPGDLVRVVASSSPFERDNFLSGVRILEGLGLRVKYRADVFEKTPYLAGSDARRFRELREALADAKTKAILFARGGYGAVRLLAALDGTRRPPYKIIAGFSDVTTLHLYFRGRWGWNGFYAPMIGGNMRQLEDRVTLGSFRGALMDPEPLGKIVAADALPIRRGVAEGLLAGGCLTLVATSLGTPYEIDTGGKILFLEDVHEKPYQIDRMLMHLKMAGKFRGCRGVVFGYLSGPNPVEHYAQTLREVFADADFPVMMNFPSGHQKRTLTLPLGVRVRLSTRDKSLTFLEPALSHA